MCILWEMAACSIVSNPQNHHHGHKVGKASAESKKKDSRVSKKKQTPL